MGMKKYFTTHNVLFWLCLICVYIHISRVFICIRIPFSFFSNTATNNLNNLLVDFATSYLVAYLVYYLTVVLKFKNERRKRIWELYDFFNNLEDVNKYIEKETGLRLDEGLTLVWFKDCYDEKIHKTIMKIITEAIAKKDVYKDVLTLQEYDLLCEIKRRLCFATPNALMQEKEIELNYKNLCLILYGIRKMYNDINKSIKNINN